MDVVKRTMMATADKDRDILSIVTPPLCFS